MIEKLASDDDIKKKILTPGKPLWFHILIFKVHFRKYLEIAILLTSFDAQRLYHHHIHEQFFLCDLCQTVVF